MTTPVVWHGTEQESSDLLAAVAHNCMCAYDMESGQRTSMCPAHTMILEQPRLDWLLYARRYWTMHLPNAGKRRL